ncbi:hypothetical protein [Pseudosulfitobacter sp. DSM 107133]|uniref:hypothetical protein n=1 Tax=Pseudosulfitobacter sp. DSM 107133 TaxID=2883100 RepID=UPI0013B38E1F|nr:hypothetical protein [Pseudosulfitobacter sp. DSM 107133]UOA29522.1 hypothetical protein DSM107133_04284 [Pseudosulfitobacter sp. DSM 107133]
MLYRPLYIALFLGAASSAVAAEWEIGVSRGLETYAATANDGTVLLVCDPDHVYNSYVNHSYFLLRFEDGRTPQKVVFLATSGEQAAFSVRDGIATHRDADPAEWAQLIDMIETGGQIAVVTARDAFTLDQDALPGLRCR